MLMGINNPHVCSLGNRCVEKTVANLDEIDVGMHYYTIVDGIEKNPNLKKNLRKL